MHYRATPFWEKLEYKLRAELDHARVHTGAGNGPRACGENVGQ